MQQRGGVQNLLAMTSSHFCAAERLFRTPLSRRAHPPRGAAHPRRGRPPPAGQGWGGRHPPPRARAAPTIAGGAKTPGGTTAPGPPATLLHYLADTHAELRDFDCIYTGDLGLVGSQMLRELLAAEGLLLKNHADCGCLLYDAEEQRVKSGGSGAGCCAAVLCGHILPKLLRRGSRRVLFLATGALMSQTTFFAEGEHPGGMFFWYLFFHRKGPVK